MVKVILTSPLTLTVRRCPCIARCGGVVRSMSSIQAASASANLKKHENLLICILKASKTYILTEWTKFESCIVLTPLLCRCLLFAGNKNYGGSFIFQSLKLIGFTQLTLTYIYACYSAFILGFLITSHLPKLLRGIFLSHTYLLVIKKYTFSTSYMSAFF